MKKIIAVLMMTIGIGNLFANSIEKTNNYSDNTKTYKSFTEIDINDLPSNIREILYFDFKDYIVKSVEVKAVNGTNIYQVTLLDIENFEYCIYITEKGTIIE